MKNLKFLLLSFIFIFNSSCFDDDLDDNIASSREVNDFIWKGMNLFYLYKDDVPDLADDRFSNNTEYGEFLDSFDSPQSLFGSLITTEITTSNKPVDPFSVIVSDFIALEEFFSGVTTRSGIEVNFYTNPFDAASEIAVVRLVLPNSEASATSIKRGDIITAIDGVTLTESNRSQLFSPQSYTATIASYDDNGTPELTDDSLVESGETITLNKQPYTENPVFITDVLEVDGESIGYLMYNGFTREFDSQLNQAFGQLAGVDHLVLDLRYNPGGSVNTSILLASLITGQNTDQVFVTEEWNSGFQQAFEENNPEALINRFVDNDDGTPLNSLNLDEVYILTTGDSASASELVISGLMPYITVKQVGTSTSGKFQASVTLYDSDDFGRQGANPAHTYAMQPLIFRSVNANGLTDYFDGFPLNANDPNFINLAEDFRDYGILGDENEPLLAAAIDDITGASRGPITENNTVPPKATSNDFIPNVDIMYTDKKLPANY